MSVPVWGATLSGPLPVAGLVGHYPTNYLMGRRPLLKRPLPSFRAGSLTPSTTCGISSPFELLFPTSGQVTYVLRTHSPLKPCIATRSAFDLHVLSTPPAFILSQDQTLRYDGPLAALMDLEFLAPQLFLTLVCFLSLFSC